MKIALCVSLSAVLAVAAPAYGQTQEPPASGQTKEIVLGPQFEQRLDELALWLRQYHAWEEWFEQWGNRVARSFSDRPIWERKERPEPPVWLEDTCADNFPASELLVTACSILRHWDEDPGRIVQRKRSTVVRSGGTVSDKVVKTSFFQRVHLTGLWTRAQFPATAVYGIVGMQVSVIEKGRITLPAVGVMLVMMPDGQGGHAWKPATTLGVGYRICDFVPPLTKKRASLHINIARTFIHGVSDERVLPSMNLNFFGLSISKGRRQ
jgi:hypothetical protein